MSDLVTFSILSVVIFVAIVFGCCAAWACEKSLENIHRDNLHVYHVMDEEEYWVATIGHGNALSIVASEVYAMELDEYLDAYSPEVFRLPDQQFLTVVQLDAKGRPTVSRTCKDWCLQCGDGVLSMTGAE